MTATTIKRTFATGIFLALGFAGGYGLIHTKAASTTKTEEALSQKTGQRRALGWEKITTSNSSSQQKKEFSNRNLKELKSWLLKDPNAEQIKEKFEALLQYPYKHGDLSLYLAMQHLLSYWGKKEPREAFENVMNLSGSWNIDKSELLSTVLAYQIEHHPSEVAGWFSDNDTRLFVYKDILPALSRSMTQLSPDEAWKWMASLRYTEQNAAIVSFFEELSRTQPHRMKEFIRQLDSPDNWGEFSLLEEKEKVKKIIRYYANADYEAAKEWTATFPEDWQDMVDAQLTGVLARKDVSKALEMLISLPQSSQAPALRMLIETVSDTNDYGKTYRLLEELVKLDLDVHRMNYSPFTYMVNPGDLQLMLNDLPKGKIKDTLIDLYLGDDLTPNPVEAEKLIYQIQDQKIKEEILKKRASMNKNK